MRLTLPALALLAFAVPAAAQAPVPAPLIARPQWLERPTGDDVNRVYPVKAANEGIGGRVVLTCQVQPDGALAGCTAEDWTPGHDFDKAALKLAPKFRMGPQAQPASVRIPLVFKPLVEAVPLFNQEIRDQNGQVLGTHEWIRKPTGEDVSRHFPAKALDKGVGGRVVLECKVKADRNVGGCKVVFESPPGFDFGEAAVKLSAGFRLKATPTGARSVVGGVVRIPLSFSTGD